MSCVEFDKDLAVEKFREYLRIKTDHPNPDYKGVINFLKQYARELQLNLKLVELENADKNVVLMSIPGKCPELPSILLNSHMDVSCSDYDKWHHDPWSAYKDEKGNVYGVGAQDMKCVGIQYLEAVRILTQLKKERFERTIYIMFMPDEQINDGTMGMTIFIKTKEFEEMNVGFVMDEGMANPRNEYSVYHAERSPWWVRVRCQGTGGHVSAAIEDPAAEKIKHVINSFLDFQKSEKLKLAKNPCLRPGDITSVGLTMLGGGNRPNSIPTEFTATFDVRIPPTVNLSQFQGMLESWCQEAGNDVTLEFLCKCLNQKTTCIGDNDPWWNAFTEALRESRVNFKKEIFPAFSDGRFLREIDIPVIGFSPMKNTPIALFNANECLNEEVFLEGIAVYCNIIRSVANMKL